MSANVMLAREEVLAILKKTGALRTGHFDSTHATGHTNQVFQMPLALRYFRSAKVLNVGLSRVLRGCDEVVRSLPHVSIVSPSSGGIPVAFGIGEVLQAEQIFWAEREDGRLRFRQFMEVHQGEKCVLVDDMIRSGRTMKEMIDLARKSGGVVLAAAVLVDQQIREVDLDGVPLYSLAEVGTKVYPDVSRCELCQQGVPLEMVRG
ncbi:MAG: phosphoribosyltransferase [Acidobacteria bacterium]|nr:phosphoribosyltransferase [Acidobacteriota bacterium]